MVPKGMVSYGGVEVDNSSNENDALLGENNVMASPRPTRRESARSTSSNSSQVTGKKTARLSKCLAIGSLLFTILVVSLVTVGNYGPNQRTLMMKQRQMKKWEKQVKKAHEEQVERLEDCEDGTYSKHTLKLAYELPFSALFKDNRGVKKFEASSVIVVGDYAYAVCDSSWAISKFGSSLTPFSSDNIQIGDPNREKEDSGYEAILHVDGLFYVVRESVLHSEVRVVEESYHSIIEEINLDEGEALDYTVVHSCATEFEFEGDSKGFEGAIAIRDLDNTIVILGLCEGNFCSESAKDKPGNGRLVAMTKHDIDGGCQWKTEKVINIPKSANFADYSAITINDAGRVAISTQEDSQLWIGQLNGQQENGLWDMDKVGFDEDDDYELFQFPKSTDCHTIYCNVEGIHWLDDNMFMAVSDKMKSKGKQDFRCFDKDQSVHAFVVP